uniref:Charged multivesicular body protein 3 n=1 Tax=Timema douglasi TaxID=61478 RepID=A0A7R8VB97_TIMDO|nr:unnamed protein product [Timema douglasi]
MHLNTAIDSTRHLLMFEQRIACRYPLSKPLASKQIACSINEALGGGEEDNTNITMNISAIQREEDKVKRSLKEAAKKGDKGVCTILAKEVIRARKAINKIHTSKAHLNSIMLQMKNQSATLRVAGALQKSTEVMQAMQNLVRVPEVAAAMRELSKEMMRVTLSILSQLTWKN